MTRACHGCGATLAPNKAPGRQRKWCSDRCRKVTLYSRSCVDCGVTINTDGRVTNANQRCVPCAAKHSGAERKVWTADAVVAAIQTWAELHGEPPAMTTWSPSMARSIGKPELAQAEYMQGKAGEWPSPQAVIRAFGTWNAAIAAAGFDPRPAHHVRAKAAA